MDVWIMPLVMSLAVMSIGLLARLGILESLNQRPAIVLSAAILAGIGWRFLNLPVAQPMFSANLADMGLATLAFGAGLQFRLSKLKHLSSVAFTLAFFASPLFVLFTAPSAFFLFQGLTLWSAILLATALMLSGSVTERRAVTNSASPESIKLAISLESAAALAVGLPFALLVEATAQSPITISGEFWMSPTMTIPIGLAVGGAVGLLLGRLRHRHRTKINPMSCLIELAIAAAIVYVMVPFINGNELVAVGAVALFWSEEARLEKEFKRNARRQIESIVAPVAYALFGFTLGPRLLQADMLVILFVVAAITLLRIWPRILLLQRIDLPSDHKAFIAWFGGAPGVATSLFLLHLTTSMAIMDQEPVLMIGITTVFISVIATRISAKPLANHFARQARLSMKRRWYASRSV